MIEIKDILINFDKLLENENLILDLIQKAIKENIKIDINKKDIKISNNILYLNIKPIYKNEIFFNKNKIISSLKENLKNKKINNIF